MTYNVTRTVNPVSDRSSTIETVIATSEHEAHAHIIADMMTDKFGSEYCTFQVTED